MWTQQTKNGITFTERYHDKNGKYKTVSVHKPKDSPKYRREAAAELAAKIERSTKGIGDFWLSDLIKVFLDNQERTNKPSSVRRSKSLSNSVLKILGDQKLDSLNAGYIRSCLLDTGRASATLNNYLVFTKQLINFAYANDMISSTACVDKIKLFPDKSHREKIQDKFLEKEELEKLLEGLEDDYYCLVVKFLALSGLRIGEALALEEDDITDSEISVTKTLDLNASTISTPKTFSSARNVVMQPQLKEVVSELRSQGKIRKVFAGKCNNYFLVGRKGDRMKYFALQSYLSKCSLEILGRNITIHALRHTHASLLMEQGVPIEVISRRLGHENSKITKEIYAHVTEKLKEKDAELLQKIAIL